MSSEVPPPSRSPRPKRVQTPFALRYRILWWVGALLPAITVGLDSAGLCDFSRLPWVTPISTLIMSVVVCSAASYSQRRDAPEMLMDLMLVLLLSLVQVTLIAWLVTALTGLPMQF